jgi:hypothetical protein
MNRFTDTDINELNKLLENDTNKYLFFVRPCYENHSPYTALAFYNIPRSNSFNNDYYPDDLYIKDYARDYASKKILHKKRA